jgi:hypothetical protein
MIELFENNEFLSIKYYEIVEENSHNIADEEVFTVIIRFPEELETNIKRIKTLKRLLKLEKSFSNEWQSSYNDEDYEMLARENKSMAKFIERLGYSQDDITNIANGNFKKVTDKSINDYKIKTGGM